MSKFPYLPAVVLVATVFGIALGLSWRIHDLEDRNADLEKQLHETLLRQPVACTPVEIVCECPDYEEGWDDAEYVSGCDPEGIDVETLEVLCSELETYGYVPHC